MKKEIVLIIGCLLIAQLVPLITNDTNRNIESQDAQNTGQSIDNDIIENINTLLMDENEILNSDTDVEIDGFGNSHKAFHLNDGENYQIYYSNNIYNGYEWNPAVQITTSTSDSMYPQVCWDDNSGVVFIIWVEFEGTGTYQYSVSDINQLTSTPSDDWFLPIQYNHLGSISGTWNAIYHDPQLQIILNQGLPDEKLIYDSVSLDTIIQRHMIHLNYNFDTRYGIADVPNDLLIDSYSNGIEGYYVVQLNTYPFERVINEIDKSGCTLHYYVPQLSFIISGTNNEIENLKMSEYIRWVGYYHPMFRIDSQLLLSSSIERISINLFRHEDIGTVSEEISDLGGTIISQSIIGDMGRIISYLHSDMFIDLSFINGIHWISSAPETTTSFNDDGTPAVQVGIQDTNQHREIFDKVTGKKQLIAVIDDGLDTDHETFFDSTCQLNYDNGNGQTNDHDHIYAYNTEYGDSDSEIGDHGTKCAGVALGNSPGIDTWDKYDGHAFGARTTFWDIYVSGQGYGHDRYSDYYPLFTKVHDNYPQKCHIASHSVGGYDDGESYRIPAEDLDRVMWENQDFLIVQAAANAGAHGEGSLCEEAISKNALVMGASNNNYLNTVRGDSSRGYTADGRVNPTAICPGESVITAWSGNHNDRYTDNNDGREYFKRTSAATPAAAGSIALIRQYLTEGRWFEDNGNKNDNYKIQNPSAALLKGCFLASAVRMDGAGSQRTSNTYPNQDQGWGRPKLRSVMNFDNPTLSTRLFDQTGGLLNNEFEDFLFNVIDDNRKLVIFLVWSDPAGNSGSPQSKQLVNNLNLILEAPNGDVYYGNNHNNQGESRTYSSGGSSLDSVNNVEAIHIPSGNLQTGTWKIRIDGDLINENEGRQPYAIVARGNIGDFRQVDVSSVRAYEYVGFDNHNGAGLTMTYFDTTSDTIKMIDIDNDGNQDCIAVEIFRDGDWRYIHYSIGWNLQQSGEFEKWTHYPEDPYDLGISNYDFRDAAVAIGHFDPGVDNKLDIIVAAVENGFDKIRIACGRDIGTDGEFREWDCYLQQTDAMGNSHDGLGLVLHDIDNNDKLDGIFMVCDDPSGNNNYRYKIGWDIGGDGSFSSFTGQIGNSVDADGHNQDGGGLAIWDIDENGLYDVLFYALDTPGDGSDNIRYRIAYDIDTNGHFDHWSSKKRISKPFGTHSSGGGVGILDMENDYESHGPEAFFMSLDNPDGEDNVRIRISYQLTHDGNPGW